MRQQITLPARNYMIPVRVLWVHLILRHLEFSDIWLPRARTIQQRCCKTEKYW